MTDIVERLRDHYRNVTDIELEAADEIERLRSMLDSVEREAGEWVEESLKRKTAEIERLRSAQAELRAALMEIADLRYECGDSECGAEHIARSALGGKNE